LSTATCVPRRGRRSRPGRDARSQTRVAIPNHCSREPMAIAPDCQQPLCHAGFQGGVMDVRMKRVYEPAASEDGYRVLIDRLWPRGVSRERAQLDEWDRELPPSSELRQWFGHEPSRFEEFRRRYIEELRNERPRIARLRRRARDGTLTLVYSARDTEHNDAVVLAEVLRRGLPKSGP
jgi:uncharacterized protein YeaO (DUF488 family)